MAFRATSFLVVALAASCGGNAHETRSIDGYGGDSASTGGRAPENQGGMPGASGAADEGGASGASDAAGAPGDAGAPGAAGTGSGDAGAPGAAGAPGTPAECADEPYGTPTVEQEPGDCKRTLCNGGGEAIVLADPSDVPEPEGPCLTPTCTNNGPILLPSPPETSCEGGFGQGLCDGLGACVECLGDADCEPDMVCGQQSCQPGGTCDDETQNGGETGADCGGSTCGTCDDGQACLIDQDCESDLCDPLFLSCLPFSCRNGAKGEDETDVDCGGATCAPCYFGESCLLNSDCTTNTCNPDTLLCFGNVCGDQRQNGTETDVDCGGLYCPPCGYGKKCHTNFECESGFCVHSVHPARCY